MNDPLTAVSGICAEVLFQQRRWNTGSAAAPGVGTRVVQPLLVLEHR